MIKPSTADPSPTESPLPEDRIAAARATHPEWQRVGESLQRTFCFASFGDALAFMQDCAPDIERLNHHPEWTNRYDQVIVSLTTHDAGNRITAKDVELAKTMEWIYRRFV